MNNITDIKGSQLRHSTLLQSNCSRGRTKPVLSDDYIVGLVDGEGCFYVNISKSRRYKAGARVGTSLHVKLQASDKELLDKVKHTFKCGEVYFQKENRPNHTQCYRFTVSSHRDILGKIVPFFTKHPLQSPSKKKNFDIFCKIMDIVKKQEHLTEVGINKIQKLKKQMNQKYTGLA